MRRRLSAARVSAAAGRAGTSVRPLSGAIARLAAWFNRGGIRAAIASWVYLAILLSFSLRYMLRCLSRSWFYSSDEYVIAAEVIRFLHLDFHQRFFDMPGTPLMMLSTAIWTVFYYVQTCFGPDPASPGILAFTYQHVDWVFTLLRSGTIFFHAGSAVLLFWLARRVLNLAGAFLACLLLTMSSNYALNSSFCRVESMAICLVLAALLVTYRALERRPSQLAGRPSRRDPMVLAGILVGVAAATRLHSITASLPLLVMILFFDERVPHLLKYPDWLLRASVYALPAVSLAGVAGYWLTRSRIAGEFPHAAALLTKVAIALAVAPGAAALCYSMRKTRPMLLRLVNPAAVKIGLACAASFAVANFTMIPYCRDFLRSIDAYLGSYIDWQRTKWPLGTNIGWHIGFYTKAFAPDTLLLVLLLAGALWIAVSRDRKLLPYLLAFLGFYISKPLNLRSSAHHTLLWLPYFSLICAYPLAKIHSLIATRAAVQTRWRLAASAVSAILFATVALQLTNGPARAAENAGAIEERLQHVSAATDWIKYYTPLRSNIAMSYNCFNPDVFYAWLQTTDVAVPPSVLDGRKYIIWWGRRGQLLGLSGYACATGGGGAVSELDRMPIADNEQMVDAYHDPAFTHVASFGTGDRSVDLFRFDLRDPAAQAH